MNFLIPLFFEKITVFLNSAYSQSVFFFKNNGFPKFSTIASISRNFSVKWKLRYFFKNRRIKKFVNTPKSPIECKLPDLLFETDLRSDIGHFLKKKQK